MALRPAEGRWFEPFAAPPDLQVRLACRYAATADGRHDLIPDGCMDLLWIEGRGVVLCGPDTRAWSFELPPGTPVVGVRFRPGAGPAVFHVDAIELRDERVALDDLLGHRLARVLDQRLGEAADPIARLGVLEQLVRQRTAAEPPDDTVELAALVASDPGYGVDGLAAATGVSTRQLRRRFDRARRVRTGVLRPHRPGAALRPPRGAGATPRDRRARRRSGYADQAHAGQGLPGDRRDDPAQLIAALPRTSVAVTLGDARSSPDAPRRDRPGWPIGTRRRR